MASRSPASIRNVAFCGHSSCGKTTLVESLLFKGGAISRKGRVEDGTTTSDYDAQEKSRKHSIDLSSAHLDFKGTSINLLDTPGYRDFVGQVYCAATAVESMVVVIDADEGVRPNTRKVWQIAEERRLPCFVVVNRMDREQAKPDQVLSQITEQLSSKCIPIEVPKGQGSSFVGVERLLGNKSLSEEGKEAQGRLTETVVESVDTLMERYLGGEVISEEEITEQLKQAISSRMLFPLLFASGEKDIGTDILLETLAQFAPPATISLGRTIHPAGKPEEKLPLKTGVEDPFCAFVFKVASDPYVGKLSFVRIFSGSLAHNGIFTNPHTGKPEKAGKIVRLQGKEQAQVEVAAAGDIVALLKVEGLKAFDTLTADKHLVYDPPVLPTPMFSRAVEPKSKADEKKFAEAIPKVIDDDVMIHANRDSRTHEMVLSGISQLHLLISWDRLRTRYGVEVITKEPKTPYLETITGKGDDHYRHKKQTGGAGEFAEVWLRVEPLERGKGVEFVNSVFGGAISASYVASAEKGIRAILDRGVIAGYPVIDVRVDIYDGKEHPVDSKDVAFQKAGREAFKLAMKQAKPVLLEPIVNLEVTFPVECMGDIQGDLNRRRGRVVGADSVGNFQTLKAQVPLSEIPDYASTLGSVTGGQGTYGIEMSHYEVMPPSIQQKVCEAAKAELEKDEG
jgi:elongation factor G